MGLIFVLVDGLGLAPSGPHNLVPEHMPFLAQALGTPLTEGLYVDDSSCYARPIDATLGVAGLPQSGSGHAAIYGGYNAAAANGRHQPSYPTVAMREQLAARSVLELLRVAGYRVAWANAYLPGYEQAVAARRLRHTAGTWSALHAGLRLRGVPELLAEQAVSWDVDQRMARRRPGCEMLPIIRPEQAGRRLALLARDYDLVAYETYLPDLAGHARIPLTPIEALDLVDGLLAGVLELKQLADTLVITSDHGNVEDTTTRVHTRNPVPLIAIGPAAPAFRSVMAIDGILDAIVEGIKPT